jgi:hypothetical protein
VVVLEEHRGQVSPGHALHGRVLDFGRDAGRAPEGLLGLGPLPGGGIGLGEHVQQHDQLRPQVFSAELDDQLQPGGQLLDERLVALQHALAMAVRFYGVVPLPGLAVTVAHVAQDLRQQFERDFHALGCGEFDAFVVHLQGRAIILPSGQLQGAFEFGFEMLGGIGVTVLHGLILQ